MIRSRDIRVNCSRSKQGYGRNHPRNDGRNYSHNYSRRFIWALMFCLGVFSTICFSCLSVSAIPGSAIPGSASTEFTLPVSSVPVSSVPVSSTSALSLIQQGIDFYETEQFSQAIERWQQALTRLAQTDLPRLPSTTAHPTSPHPIPSETQLHRALIWSNLSSAYQKLGQWQAAETAIAHSFQGLQILETEPPSLAHSAIQAKAWNTQGQLDWAKGRFEAALQAWQQATAYYQAANESEGMIIATLNQANALQSLGFSLRAQQQLEQIQHLLAQQPDRLLRANGLRSLGNAQRRMGQLHLARQTLQASLAQLHPINPSELVGQNPLKHPEAWQAAAPSPTDLTADQVALQSMLFLDLGNLDRTIAERVGAVGKTREAQEALNSADQFYQQALAIAPQSRLKLQALLNRFQLQVEQQQPSPAIALIPDIQASFSALPPSRFTWYAQLNFADTLLQLHTQSGQSWSDPVAIPALPDIAKQLAIIVQQSQTQDDRVAQSYALGELGKLYEQANQWGAAEQFTQQALSQAEAIQAPEIRYRWEWQLGRLQKQQGQHQAAIAAYTAAVQSLQSVRHDLLNSSSDLQFSFRDTVEPIYRELVALLLSHRSEPTKLPSQAVLQQSLELVDTLQLTELENFLGCELSQRVKLNQLSEDRTTAKLYPMLLPDRLAVILELPNTDQPLLYHEVPLSQQAITTQLQQLRQDLSTADRTPEAIQGLQVINQWLIQPFQSVLQQNPQITTLVFVLDGPLRNIPMAALYNGDSYLVQHYAVALSPRLELFQPTPRPPTFKPFLAGVGEPQTINQQRFPKIEYLDRELSEISQITGAKTLLLNQEFTKASLEQRLRQTNFSAIHIKTHGTFSSDPEETFIVAYQEVITGQDLGQLIHTERLGKTGSIELLVLSACSTAAGDNRAVLGLAGTAVQAGAKTVVSTLWEAQDWQNTQLMRQFYQALSDPETTRAQALRQAQLTLLSSGYVTPHIWAPYVLVGNWL